LLRRCSEVISPYECVQAVCEKLNFVCLRIGAGYRYTGVQLTARKGYAYGQPALRPVCKLQFPVKLGGELRGNGEA
jgi:hypothetical protein